VPRLTRPTFRVMSPVAAHLTAEWTAIVGPMLAGSSTPRKLSSGTLTIACAGPVAMELQHYAPVLIERINMHLGSTTVQALRFMQVAPFAPPAVPPRPPPSPAAVAAAETAVAELPEGELRAALAALGRAVLDDRKPSTARSNQK